MDPLNGLNPSFFFSGRNPLPKSLDYAIVCLPGDRKGDKRLDANVKRLEELVASGGRDLLIFATRCLLVSQAGKGDDDEFKSLVLDNKSAGLAISAMRGGLS